MAADRIQQRNRRLLGVLVTLVVVLFVAALGLIIAR